jgi:large subunit ribosomal protein L1
MWRAQRFPSFLIVYTRTYISYAHPKPRPTYHVFEAVDMILEGAAQRREKRLKRWNLNFEKRKAKALSAAAAEGPPMSDYQETPYRNIDETVEIAIKTGLDPRKPNQTLRGSVTLPHGTGIPVKVLVFTSTVAGKAEALEAGAAIAGGDELIASIVDGSTSLADYQRAVASPEMLPKLGKVAKILGPRGLMPNPKLGTISPVNELAKAVRRQMAGLINYRVDKTGNVHVPLGKVSFGKDKILDHIRVLMNEVTEKKPDGAKGTYLKKVYLSASQGEGIKIELNTVNPGSAYFMMPPDVPEQIAA